jgi:hypothetical protein
MSGKSRADFDDVIFTSARLLSLCEEELIISDADQRPLFLVDLVDK